MSAETDTRAAEALQRTQQFLSVLEDQMHRTKTETFTATDEAETVEVTVNAERWLTDLRIEHGLLRLGAETVRERINEALRKAQATALSAAEKEEGQLENALTSIVGALQEQLGDLPG
jgi:DNA-binding protein YbaB